jgi:hypothetical protein
VPRERIGDAYVRVHADGRGMGKEVAKDFDDFDPVIRSKGEQHGKAYSKAFAEQVDKQGKADLFGFTKNIREAFGRFDAGSKFVADFEDSLVVLRKEVASEHGPEIGERLAQGIRDAMQRGAIQTRRDYIAAISDLRPAITRITAEIDRENEAALTKMLRAQEQRLKEIERGEAETSKEVIGIKRAETAAIIASIRDRVAAEEDAARKQQILAQKVLDFQVRMQKQRVVEDKRTLTEITQLEEMFNRLRTGTTRFADSERLAIQRTRELTQQVRHLEANGDEAEETLRRIRIGLIVLTPRLNRASTNFERLADRVGRLTGRGSRNNFLNFVGSVNRNILRLTSTVTLGFLKMTTAAGTFFKELVTGGLSFKDLKTLGLSAIQAIGGGITTLITFGVVVGAVALSAGVLSAALSGLIALLTALAGTLAFAAAAALPALTAGLLPLAAGIGVVIAAFQGLDEAQKKALKNDLKPLTDSFKGLADAAADVLFQDVGKWARQLKPIIDDLEPGIIGVAKAIRFTLGDAIDSAAESPKMEHFIERMNRFLPNAVRKLGDIFTNVFEGIGGVILAMLPTINRFLGWLGDITQEFSNWANSKGGRKELREFFRDAGDSASALGDFLGDATRLLGKLLSAGRKEGDGIFRDMASAAGDLVDYLRSPEGQAALADWLEWGRDLGEALGELVVAAGQLVAALDTPSTRAALLFLVEGFTDLMGLIAQVPSLLALLNPVATIVVGFKLLYDEIVKVTGAIDAMVNSDNPLIGLLGSTTGLTGALSLLDKAFGGSKEAAEPFIKTLVDGLEPIPGLTGDVAASIDGMRDSLDRVTGAATEATKALALQHLQESGLIQTGRELGISARTLVSAFTGNKTAARDLVSQFLSLNNTTAEQRVAFQQLLQSMGLHVNSLRAERNEIQQNNKVTRSYKGLLEGLPKEVKTTIREFGAKPTVRSIASVIDKARELGGPKLNGKQIRTLISATGEKPTRAMIERIRARLKVLNQQETKPKVELDVKPFTTRQADIDSKLRAGDRKKTTPKADLDLREFNTREDEMRRKITAMSALEAKPKGRLELSQFYQDRANLISSLNSIPDEYVTVHVRREGGGTGTTSAGVSDPPGGNPVVPTRGPGIDVGGITVISNSDDPKAVAQETLNRIVALSY